MAELEKLAYRVAQTHNGKHFPRSEQIKAIQKLQAYFKNPRIQDQVPAKASASGDSSTVHSS